MSLLAELKRRKVLKVGAAYLVVAWVIVQVASIVLPTFEAPVWVLRVFILLLMLGFPLALVLAWVLEITPDGMRVETAPVGNKRMFGIAAGLAVLAVAWYYVGQPALRNGAPPPPAPVAAAPVVPKVAPASIAVLPFIDMSQGKDQEYFSDGITEEILNALTRVEGLKVAGRTSSFHFKGRNENLQAIGAALGVAHVLEGSVRKQGDRIRITAQLIKVDDGFHVWSQNYDRKLDDIFAVQDEISAAIATALKSKLMTGEGAGGDIDPAVYDTYLRARQELASRQGKRIVESARLFAEVNERAPDFDAAWSGRAKALMLVFNYTGGAADGGKIAQIEQAGERALALNPGNAEALSMLAFNDVLNRWKFDSALERIRAATAIAPNDAEVANFAGDVFRATGDYDEALRWERRAIELDPLFKVNHNDYAWALLTVGRHREALEPAERALRLDPDFWSALFVRATVHTTLGEYAAARADIDAMERLDAPVFILAERRAALAIAEGHPDQARAFVDELERLARAGESIWYFVAKQNARLGDHAAAADALERALDDREPTFAVDVESLLPEEWPDDPAIQAQWARAELAPMVAMRRKYFQAHAQAAAR